MIKIKGLGRIEQVVESPGGGPRSLTLSVAADELVFEVKISTQSPDMDLRTAAILDENIDVEVSG